MADEVSSAGDGRLLWDPSNLKNQLAPLLDIALLSLASLWEDIGIEPDQQVERTRAVARHITSLLDEMVAEELALRDRLQRNVDSYMSELAHLSIDLALPPPELDISSSLLRQEKCVREKVGSLSTEKAQRLHRLQHLSEQHSKLHDTLGMMNVSSLSFDGVVPSREWLENLEAKVGSLEQERAVRFGKFMELRFNIITVLNDLGDAPSTPFEDDVAIEEPDCFHLSDENMAALEVLNDEVKQKLIDRKLLGEKLRAMLVPLWRQLDVPQNVCDSFLEENGGHNLHAIETIRAEIARCEKLKMQQIEKMVRKVREEVQLWWSKCHIGPKQQRHLEQMTCGSCDEEVLLAYEREIEKLRQLYNDYSAVLFEPLACRADLWAKMLEFDAREHDPSRFTNRGGGLLKEEKERKRILRELPKVEQELKDACTRYEQDLGVPFLVQDVKLADFCRQQWDEYYRQKEDEKQERLNAKSKAASNDATLSGKPPTPLKRRLEGDKSPPSGTPKLRKLNNTTSLSVGMLSFSRAAHTSVFASPTLREQQRSQSRTPLSHRKPPVTPGKAANCRGMLAPSNKPPVTPGKAANFQGVLTPSNKCRNMGPAASPLQEQQKNGVFINQSSGSGSSSSSSSTMSSLSSVASYHEFKDGIEYQGDENCQSSTLLHA